MRSCGIVVEYNPFHNGHRYHAEKARELSGADIVVAVMSGNFLQRGEPAITDKWSRAAAALENGVDLVVELPFHGRFNLQTILLREALNYCRHSSVMHSVLAQIMNNNLTMRIMDASLLRRSLLLINYFMSYQLDGVILKNGRGGFTALSEGAEFSTQSYFRTELCEGKCVVCTTDGNFSFS